ncbi:DUF317 domain-containing protein [Streptomyces griseus]|uniref:DUF317 domain-containing protein n=1 Tax=Streptomyces griseus TaxID=1911 RepID=UPI00386C3CF3|nr:DUF317 domain-containing protein [Streptomyces fimicarius]
MTRPAPEELVLISPRHLAGGGIDKIRDALGPLIHLFGWTSEKRLPQVSLASPGGEAFLDFAPGRQDGVWWRIEHHEPFWRAEFTRQVPVEAIAAVAQALPQVLGDHRHADRIPFADEYPAQIAKRHGWAVHGTTHGVTWRSPDGHCTVEHTTDPEHAWRFTHSVHDGVDTHWTANFTVDTPDRVVAQFLTHLADEEPVQRRFGDVPHIALGAAVITSARTAGLGAHTQHALEQIGHTLASGRPRDHRPPR